MSAAADYIANRNSGHGFHPPISREHLVEAIAVLDAAPPLGAPELPTLDREELHLVTQQWPRAR